MVIITDNCFQVPRVLVHCAEFIEKRGMIDGIYRLSGIASTIQKLRVAFDEDRVPNLYDDRAVMQDIHCVSSLLKMYFRELPNPVCTYHLYERFVEATKAQGRTIFNDVVAFLYRHFTTYSRFAQMALERTAISIFREVVRIGASWQVIQIHDLFLP